MVRPSARYALLHCHEILHIKRPTWSVRGLAKSEARLHGFPISDVHPHIHGTDVQIEQIGNVADGRADVGRRQI